MRRSRNILIVLIVFFVVLLVVFCLCGIAYKKFYSVFFTAECAKIDENGAVVKTGVDSIYFVSENPYNLYANIKTIWVLHFLEVENKNSDVSDVELVRFVFQDDQLTKTKEVVLAYDFCLKDVFLQKNGDWYKVKNPEKINPIIQNFFDASTQYSRHIWKGQSTYAHEDFVETDFTNSTFRYHLYWGQSKSKELIEEINFQDSNFNNVMSAEIHDYDSAIQRAANELGYKKPIGVAFYDEICGYWMVELYDDPETQWDKSMEYVNQYTDFLYDNVKTVVMNDKGITLEIYDGCIRYTPFLVKTGWILR